MPKQKLLLADDSITIQKVVNLTFADEGIEVISVGDGDTAMQKFVETSPDLVMVDVNMPGLDGYRICEMIKQDDETKHVPVILLVGSFEPFDEDEARRVGANDYLTKPFQSIRQLVSKVSVLLSKSNGDGYPDQTEEASSQPEVLMTEESEPVLNTFDNPGFDDDEMIQANQIGSLPVDELHKFESDNSIDEQTPISSFDFYSEPVPEIDSDYGKTKPFTAEEYDEISSNIPESEQFEAAERIFPVIDADEDRAVTLEKQMVSEFETEGMDFDSPFTAVQEEFEPGEIADEPELKVGDPIDKRGFEIQEVEPAAETVELDSVDDWADSANGDWETYASPENPIIPEPEEPYHYVEYITGEEKTDSEPKKANEPFKVNEADQIHLKDSEPVFENPYEVKPSHESEIDESESDDETFETWVPDSAPTDNFPQIPEKAEVFEGDDSIDSADEQIAPEPVISEPELVEEVDDAFDQAENLSDFDSKTKDANAPLTVEIPQPIPTIEEEVSPIQEIPAVEFEPAEATTESPVSAMISSKDKNDSVESVIVSEFARHSISLSSEAVETIAARIAEKISEKIVQQLATDVVTDLADLIVDRMEQRKLK